MIYAILDEINSYKLKSLQSVLIEKWLDSERVGRATSLLINFFLFISPQYYLLLIRIRSSFAI